MFTGLIKAICRVNAIRKSSGSMQLSINLGNLAQETRIGDSIAVNGVCLTVTKLTDTNADFDVSAETLSISNFNQLNIGSEVNIELAIKPSDRFGGHFVQGHVDGLATVRSIEKHADFSDITFDAPAQILKLMIPKGSVAVNGISLTIARLDPNSFTVAIIPQTSNCTNLTNLKIGDFVNIENDIITKTVKIQLENILPQQNGMTLNKLKELGF
ncbi:MAG: riboflavin synthase [Planctomycetota bacterium]|jgi:riboflavin synthase